jgi:hypothetical protein
MLKTKIYSYKINELQEPKEKLTRVLTKEIDDLQSKIKS